MTSHIPTASDRAIADELFEEARRIRLRAYAPYSKFLVGAAILTANGKVYAGCNVETANYDGTHAEESALSAMVAGGDRSPKLLVVLGGLEKAAAPASVPPCGKCRQALTEFSSLSGRDLRVLVRDKARRLRAIPLSDLLPMSFGPGDIGVNLAKYRRGR